MDYLINKLKDKKYYYGLITFLIFTIFVITQLGSCILGTSLYLWSVIFYLFTFAMFNKENEMGDISIISILLPFIPILNVIIGILTFKSFLKKWFKKISKLINKKVVKYDKRYI